jgi:Predicted oxidoreductases (related to aryl-alcohol dehydrogenases)
MAGPARRAPRKAFPADWIVSCTERSLQNLGLETIDVQQFHVWSDEWVGQGDWLDGIERLKRDGKIRFFGVSINDHQPENAIRLVESGLVDTVQVIYNVFDQSPRTCSSPPWKRRRVGVIVRVPLDEGALTGSVRPETTFPEGDFRNRYFAGERSARCGSACRRSPVTSTSRSTAWQRSRSASA